MEVSTPGRPGAGEFNPRSAGVPASVYRHYKGYLTAAVGNQRITSISARISTYLPGDEMPSANVSRPSRRYWYVHEKIDVAGNIAFR